MSFTPLAELGELGGTGEMRDNAHGPAGNTDDKSQATAPHSGHAPPATALPGVASDTPGTVDNRFIEDIIAELNAAPTSSALVATGDPEYSNNPPVGSQVIIAERGAPSVPAASDPVALVPEGPDEQDEPTMGGKDLTTPRDAVVVPTHAALKSPPSCSDAAFWGYVFRGLQDPLVVGMVVVLLSSPTIQRRITAFVPLFMGDSVQGTLLRLLAGCLLYIAFRRIVLIF